MTNPSTRENERPIGVLRAAAAAIAALTALALAAPGAQAAVRGALAPAGLHVQELGFCGGDDWEPDVAADDQGHVYVAITHFAGDPTCDPASAHRNHRIMVQASDDGGRTFRDPILVADTPGGLDYPGQADPSLALDRDTGALYVAFLAFATGIPTGVYVARSDDHGLTFPQVVHANGPGCNLCDHEKVIARGDLVYVAFSQGGKHFVSTSTDGGVHFTQHLVATVDRVAFAENGAFDPAGNAWFSWADCLNPNCNHMPASHYRVSETLAGTANTTLSDPIAAAPRVPRCPFDVCGFSYFGPQDALAIDAAGRVYLIWQGANDPNAPASPPLINLSSCAADCASASNWSFVNRVDDKTAYGCPDASCYASWPNIVGGSPGRIAVTWMDDRNDGVDGTIDHIGGWNLWYRTSLDGGASWTAPGKRVSRYDPSQSQSEPQGFLFPYGDYTGLTMNPNCPATQPAMAWGEGHNYAGGPSAPGHIEYASFC